MGISRPLSRGILAGMVAGLVLSSPAGALEVGQKAPDFKLDASNGQAVQLVDLLGKGPVVIYTFIQAFGGV
jgi:cytochrome oxidase Cu insertion factor (SCO1/SenC/PrrC family)